MKIRGKSSYAVLMSVHSWRHGTAFHSYSSWLLFGKRYALRLIWIVCSTRMKSFSLFWVECYSSQLMNSECRAPAHRREVSWLLALPIELLCAQSLWQSGVDLMLWAQNESPSSQNLLHNKRLLIVYKIIHKNWENIFYLT